MIVLYHVKEDKFLIWQKPCLLQNDENIWFFRDSTIEAAIKSGSLLNLGKL